MLFVLKTRLGEEKAWKSSPKGKAINWNKISTTTRFLTFSTVISLMFHGQI